jgi:hypothetical protein
MQRITLRGEMGLDTKTDNPIDRQSLHNFKSDFELLTATVTLRNNQLECQSTMWRQLGPWFACETVASR